MIDMITWFSRGFLEKWDGVNWELAPYTGSHPNLTCAYLWGPLKLAPDAFGNMYAISDTDYSWNPCNFNSSNVIKWNGTEWTQLGTGCNVLGAYGQLADLCTDPAGNVYAAGTIKNSLNHLYIAKWNGSAWGELGNDPLFFTSSDFTSLCSDASGNIYASGPWDELNHLYVAKFNGTTWEKLSFRDFQNGSIGTICTDPGGTLYAAGDFSNYYNGKDVYNVAKYVGLTGIKEERNIPVVDVCPNPADEDVTIRVEKYLPGSVYLLIDSFGRTVRTGVLSGLVSVIDLKSLATGLYFFSLVNQPGSTVKLVKR